MATITRHPNGIYNNNTKMFFPYAKYSVYASDEHENTVIENTRIIFRYDSRDVETVSYNYVHAWDTNNMITPEIYEQFYAAKVKRSA